MLPAHSTVVHTTLTMDLLPSAQLPDLETCDSEDAFAKKEMLNSFGFMLEPGAGSDLTTICNELTWKIEHQPD